MATAFLPTSFRGSRKWLAPVLGVGLLVLPYGWAQETTAGFQGTVKDNSGAVIPDVKYPGFGPRANRDQESADR